MPTLVLQRGHVPRTTGATGTAGEQEVVTAIAAEVNRYKPAGWTVRIINADEPVERYAGDVFIALHCDGSANPLSSGASVGYQTNEGNALAQRWKAAYKAHGWPYGFRDDNYTSGLRYYYGYKYAKVYTPAYMVVEHGFLTNKAKDAPWIRSHYRQCAAAIWDAVAEEEEVERTHIAITITDYGDVAHRSAITALAAKWQDLVIETSGSALVHAKAGEDADAFIAYAKANGLPASSITVDGASHETMVVRNVGKVPPVEHPVDTASQERIAHLESSLDEVAKHARDILMVVN